MTDEVSYAARQHAQAKAPQAAGLMSGNGWYETAKPGPAVGIARPDGPPITEVIAQRLSALDALAGQMAERSAHLVGRLGLEPHGPEPADPTQPPGTFGVIYALLDRLDAAARLLDRNLRELERL